MTMLSESQLAYFQATVTRSLDLTADIQRNQSSTIVLGQKTEDYQSILPDGPIACGMTQPSRAMAQQYAGLIGIQQATVFSFSDGQDVQRGDRIVTSGTTWTVQALLSPQSYSVSTQVLATKIG